MGKSIFGDITDKLNIGMPTDIDRLASSFLSQLSFLKDTNIGTGSSMSSSYDSEFNNYSSPSMASSSGGSEAAMKALESTANADKSDMMYLEALSTPDIFTSADALILGFGPPTMEMANNADDFPVLGFCTDFSFNVSSSVTAFSELRNETTIVIPGKARAGSIQLSRMLTTMPSFAGKVAGKGLGGWLMDPQDPHFRRLFGIYMLFMSPVKRGSNPIIARLYAERCAISSLSIGVRANQSMLSESAQIACGRIRTVGAEAKNEGSTTK